MPTIDELLDDLGLALWFSKLDLRQGFHKILMVADNIKKTVSALTKVITSIA